MSQHRSCFHTSPPVLRHQGILFVPLVSVSCFRIYSLLDVYSVRTSDPVYGPASLPMQHHSSRSPFPRCFSCVPYPVVPLSICNPARLTCTESRTPCLEPLISLSRRLTLSSSTLARHSRSPPPLCTSLLTHSVFAHPMHAPCHLSVSSCARTRFWLTSTLPFPAFLSAFPVRSR